MTIPLKVADELFRRAAVDLEKPRVDFRPERVQSGNRARGHHKNHILCRRQPLRESIHPSEVLRLLLVPTVEEDNQTAVRPAGRGCELTEGRNMDLPAQPGFEVVM